MILEEILFSNFDERELRLIKNCLTYAVNDPAGLPGHNLIVIVAKLMKMIQDPSEKYRLSILKSTVETYLLEKENCSQEIQDFMKTWEIG